MKLWLTVVVFCVACSRDGSRADHGAGVAPVAPAPAPAPRAQPPFEVPAPTDAIVAIARGDRHACVVRASGALDCWGQPITKHCKDCFTDPAPDPTVRRVPGVTDAIAIDSQARCVVHKTGEVGCLDESKLELVPVAGLANATAIAGQTYAPCVIVGKGDIACVDPEHPGTPLKTPNVHDAIALAAGGVVCALRKTGQVWCGNAGEAMRRLAGLDHVSEIAAAGSRAAMRLCATVEKSGLHCYALDPFNKLALSEKIAADAEPLLAAPIAGASQLSVWSEDNEQEFFAEAVVDGKVERIEFGTYAPAVVADVPQLTDVKLHARRCAVRAQGSVVCWGDNNGGVLGQPTTIGQVRLPPAPVVGLANVTSLAISDTHAMAMTNDHTIWDWGLTPDYKSNAVPTRYKLLSGSPTDFVEIAGVEGELCARRATGETWCEDHPPLMSGEEPSIKQASPAQLGRVPWRSGLETRETTADFVCQRTKDGHVTCGENKIAVDKVDEIAAGIQYACARRIGRISCWMLDPIKHTVEPPADIPGITDASSLVGGPDQACAIHARGKVTCWSVDGDPSRIGAPQQVLDGQAMSIALGSADWERLAFAHDNDAAPAAERLGCAILANRTVTCWGANLHGELGDGSLIASEQPIGIRL